MVSERDTVVVPLFSDDRESLVLRLGTSVTRTEDMFGLGLGMDYDGHMYAMVVFASRVWLDEDEVKRRLRQYAILVPAEAALRVSRLESGIQMPPGTSPQLGPIADGSEQQSASPRDARSSGSTSIHGVN
jgi:hypothetical protein